MASANTTAPSVRFASLTAACSRSLAHLSVSLAQSSLDRKRALELHRDVYRRKGLLPEKTLRPQVLPQAFVPGSALFVAKEHGATVGTIAFYMDSKIGLPMDHVHEDEVNAMRRRFPVVAEVGGLAVLEEHRSLGITMMLYQAAFRWAVATHAGCIVACVNPSSRRVYSRKLFFEVLGESKRHPRFLGAPSIPIGLELNTLRTHRSSRLYQFFTDPLNAVAAGPGSGHYLQWPTEEMSELIVTQQVDLDGIDRNYLEQQYAIHALRGPSTTAGR